MELYNNRQAKPQYVNRTIDFRKITEFDDNSILSLKKRFIQLIQSNLLETNRTFKIDDTNRQNLAFIFDWIIGKCEVEKRKGLMLVGEIGLGKSAIMKAVSELVKEIHECTSIYITANNVARLYRSKDDDAAIKINRLITCKLLFIDDIGTEDRKVYDTHPIEEIIRERYEMKRITSFTTNLSSKELIDRYTQSIEDKISHMTFLVPFKGQSKRT